MIIVLYGEDELDCKVIDARQEVKKIMEHGFFEYNGVIYPKERIYEIRIDQVVHSQQTKTDDNVPKREEREEDQKDLADDSVPE